MRDYKKIRAWEAADKLVLKIYEVTKRFPKEEMYGLTSQMRRAVISIPANIAEGSGRASQKEYLQYLYIARASARETEYYISLSYKLEYIGDLVYRELSKLSDDVLSILFGLIQAVSNQNYKSAVSSR